MALGPTGSVRGEAPDFIKEANEAAVQRKRGPDRQEEEQRARASGSRRAERQEQIERDRRRRDQQGVSPNGLGGNLDAYA